MGKQKYPQTRLRFYDHENDKIILDWLKTIPRGAINCLIKEKLAQAIQMDSNGKVSTFEIARNKQVGKANVSTGLVRIPEAEKSTEGAYKHMDRVLECLDDL